LPGLESRFFQLLSSHLLNTAGRLIHFFLLPYRLRGCCKASLGEASMSFPISPFPGVPFLGSAECLQCHISFRVHPIISRRGWAFCRTQSCPALREHRCYGLSCLFFRLSPALDLHVSVFSAWPGMRIFYHTSAPSSPPSY